MTMTMNRLLLCIVATLLATQPLLAQQRRVSPVTKSNNRTMTSTELAAKQKELAAKGFVILGDSIVSDSIAMIESDSIRARRMQYPKYTSLIVGVNLWDPLMRMLGQSYGGIDFSAELSMWNRFHPIAELGIGWANNTPEDMNFTYKGKPSLYAKIGLNYNLKYNNSPAYVALLGFRLGYSSFGYDIEDISVVNSYWDQAQELEILDQKSHALWWELVLSLKIKLWGNISAGWAVRYHKVTSYKKNDNSTPWYIPGYGNRESNITGSLSLYYTIPIGKKKTVPAVDVDDSTLVPPPEGDDVDAGAEPGQIPEEVPDGGSD